MYKIISFADETGWKKALKQINRKDIYYSQSYCRLYRALGDGDPYLFFYRDGRGNKLCYVFIKRPVRTLRHVNTGLFEREFFDIITPYGYGGPLYDYADDQLIRGFRRAFEAYCREENIISEFIRFHPLLKNHHYLESFMDVVYDRETIYIDLNKSGKEIFQQYHKNHRRNIRKAQKNRLTFRMFTKEDAMDRAEIFYGMYKKTMDRVGASPYAYFSLDYMKDLLSGLYGNVAVGASLLDGEIVSAALCMYEGGLLHYHLGCSKEEYFHLGTNIFQFHNIALWGRENGCHAFHLGGGHRGRDSLFKFKHRFSPKGTLGFYVGKKIHQPQLYKLLVEHWERYYAQEAANGFFPEYRREVLV